MSGQSSSPTYRAPRLFVEADLVPESDIALTREHARYLMTVLRRDLGAPVHVFNGRHGEWSARLEPIGRDRAILKLVRQVKPPPTPARSPWLAFAAVKRGPVELIIEKATELGVARLLPVRTVRSNTERLNSDRLRRIAIEAAEQSERIDVPEIAPLAPLDQMLSGWPSERLLFVGDETGGAPPALTALREAAGADFGLLVGPEGGFAPGEVDAFDQFAFVRRIGLGPRVLRAETAAIVGLALLQATIGDLADTRVSVGIGN